MYRQVRSTVSRCLGDRAQSVLRRAGLRDVGQPGNLRRPGPGHGDHLDLDVATGAADADRHRLYRGRLRTSLGGQEQRGLQSPRRRTEASGFDIAQFTGAIGIDQDQARRRGLREKLEKLMWRAGSGAAR